MENRKREVAKRRNNRERYKKGECTKKSKRKIGGQRIREEVEAMKHEEGR